LDPSRAESRLPARALVLSVIPNGSGIDHQCSFNTIEISVTMIKPQEHRRICSSLFRRALMPR